jgi:DNA-binding response OmpR family regulator
MRVLLVEDDEALAKMLIRVLRDEAYAVDHAGDGQEGEWLAFENPYDVIILDLMLPLQDGVSVLRKIRDAGNKVPVMILTARDDKEITVEALDAGADDYLTKPFSIDEFLARVRVLLRRQRSGASAKIKAGPIEIDTARKEIKVGDEPIELTTKEYALLEYFARNPGHVLSRTQLSEHVWDMNFEPSSNVVDVYIGYLRNKIDKHLTADQSLIKTVRGHGYMLDVPTEAKFA